MGRMSFTQEVKAWGKAGEEVESPVATGAIRGMSEAESDRRTDVASRPLVPVDDSRLEMMRREKSMTVEQRIELFARLSRDAAWIRSSAKRVR